jgi:hypothetical protein
MRVEHGGGHVGVAEHFLHGTDVGAAPVDVGLFRTPAVVQQTDALTELIQYLG